MFCQSAFTFCYYYDPQLLPFGKLLNVSDHPLLKYLLTEKHVRSMHIAYYYRTAAKLPKTYSKQVWLGGRVATPNRESQLSTTSAPNSAAGEICSVVGIQLIPSIWAGCCFLAAASFSIEINTIFPNGADFCHHNHKEPQVLI